MNIAKQIEGERLSRDVAEYVRALEEVKVRRRPFSVWTTVILVALGSLCGVSMTLADDASIRILLNVSTGVALLLGAAATGECIRLRRQLDAVLVLLRKNSTSRE